MQTLPSLDEQYIANGDVLFIYYDFPLTTIHPQAMVASIASRCVGEQGAAAYWAFHDGLMIDQGKWSNNDHEAVFTELVTSLNLDVDAFTSCFSNNEYEAQILAEMDDASSRGVRSTPNFFINDFPFVGAQPLSAFEEAIAVINEGGEYVADSDSNTPSRQAPDPVTINLDDAAVAYGDPNAPVTIVEYTDYQCPFCARHAQQTLPAILNQMVESGQVYYLIKDFPLEQIHPQAMEAAVAARCAGEQGYYSEMHDILFAEQNELQSQADDLTTFFTGIATELGLDGVAFSSCLESGRYNEIIQANLDEGSSFGVNGTPAFFINGYPVSGAQPYDLFEYAVDLAAEGRLAEAYSDNPPPPRNSGDQGPAEIPEENAVLILGSEDAPITIVEYTDFQCPFCQRHAAQTFPQLQEKYIDTGIVRYVFKDFPLQSIHPEATIAAEAARCAGDQGAWLEMHDVLFGSQGEWSGRSDILTLFNSYAADLGLDTAVFQACVESRQYTDAVEADLQEGISLGVQGTPSFFFNGYFLSGAQPFEVFEQAIDQLLEAE